MKKQSYQERVQALAEKMYRDDEGLKQDSPIARLDWIISGELYIKRARIAVVEMWLNAQLAYHNAYMDAQEGKDCDFEKFAKEHGLIPDDGQEVGTDD